MADDDCYEHDAGHTHIPVLYFLGSSCSTDERTNERMIVSTFSSLIALAGPRLFILFYAYSKACLHACMHLKRGVSDQRLDWIESVWGKSDQLNLFFFFGMHA